MTRIGQPDHGDHVTLWMIYTYLHDDVILYYNIYIIIYVHDVHVISWYIYFGSKTWRFIFRNGAPRSAPAGR